MKSLREEIKAYIDDIHYDYEPDVCDVDKILKMVEKRIDSLPPASSTQHFKASKDINQTLAYVTGYEDAAEKIEEMLK